MKMTGREAMRHALNGSGITQQEVANRAGYARQTNVAEVLRSENARVDNMVRILNACGYDLVMVARDDPDDYVVIDTGK